MIKKVLIQTLSFTIFCFFFVGCSSDSPAENGASVITPNSPINQTVNSLNSPLPSPVSPTATTQPLDKVVLDEPIKIGDTSVSGTGPPNVPILIFEVANTANRLGQLVIPQNGKFSITFENRPLQVTERVGVTLDIDRLADAGFEYRDFREIAIREVPTYGYILADVAVQE